MGRYAVLFLFTLCIFTIISTSQGPSPVPAVHANPGGYLILSEISPWQSDGAAWVELYNPAGDPCPLSGWSIQFITAQAIALPQDAPDCPPNGFVLIRIDPQLTDEASLQGNTVHVDIARSSGFPPEGDGCVLIGPDGPTDVLSWGNPDGGFVNLPFAPGSPLRPDVEVIHEGTELYLPGDVCMRLPGTWPPSNAEYIGSYFWTIRGMEDASPGLPNPPPGPLGMRPADGARLASDFNLVVMGVDWAAEFYFQISEDEYFSEILVEATVETPYFFVDNLLSGTYFWRAQGIDDSGVAQPWFPVRQFTKEPFDLNDLLNGETSGYGTSQLLNLQPDRLASSAKGGPPGLRLAASEVCREWRVLGATHLQQRKDTDMVCIDGCTMSGTYPWDGPHPIGSSMEGGHKDIYCARACTSMIAGIAGRTLSQDRVSYYIFQEIGSSQAKTRAGHPDDPRGDLGHDRGLSDQDICQILDWLYGAPGAVSRTWSSTVFDDGDPSDMDSIKEFIDDGRPVLRDIQRRTDTHATLLDGYAIVDWSGGTTNYVHVLDPWVPGDIQWESIGEDDTRFIEFPPPNGFPQRSDESTIRQDSDGDGLVDFDEVERFWTDPNDRDSDDDGLDDKTDILGYLFDPSGSYHERDPDIDGDDIWKELDPDNDTADNSGVTDGCEDYDLDGFLTPGGRETDQFDGSDDGNVMNPYCNEGTITIDSTIYHPAFPTVPLRVREVITIEPGAIISTGDYSHDYYWELVMDGMSMPVPGGSIVTIAEGYGEGLARVQLTLHEGGRYTIVTDTNPRVGTYTIETFGPGVHNLRTEQIHLGLADHHFDYVSSETPAEVMAWLESVGGGNLFNGTVTRTPDGVRIAKGEDIIPIPSFLVGCSGETIRTWEFRLDRLPGR